MHGITSAKYSTADNGPSAPVIAIMTNGATSSRRANDDIEGGGMLAYLAGGGVIDPYIAPPLAEADYASAIQTHIDSTAQGKPGGGYADGYAATTYLNSTIPAWAAEAAAFIAWRDAVWIYAYTELAKVQGGQREVPTVAELIEELPTIVWP